MLAAVAWPLQEILHPILVDQLRTSIPGVRDVLAETNGFSPSLLNGGLDKVTSNSQHVFQSTRACITFLDRILMSMRYGVQVSPAFFMGIIIFSATLEAVALTRIRTSDYTPGDLGFDPLR